MKNIAQYFYKKKKNYRDVNLYIHLSTVKKTLWWSKYELHKINVYQYCKEDLQTIEAQC